MCSLPVPTYILKASSFEKKIYGKIHTKYWKNSNVIKIRNTQISKTIRIVKKIHNMSELVLYSKRLNF